MLVGLRQADLLGFSHTTVSRVFTHNSGKTKQQQRFSGRKYLVDERGQRRLTRLVKADRKATVTQITTLYNCGLRVNNMLNLEIDELQQQRPHHVPLLSVSQEQRPETERLSRLH